MCGGGGAGGALYSEFHGRAGAHTLAARRRPGCGLGRGAAGPGRDPGVALPCQQYISGTVQPQVGTCTVPFGRQVLPGVTANTLDLWEQLCPPGGLGRACWSYGAPGRGQGRMERGLRKPALLNSAQQSTSFSPLPCILGVRNVLPLSLSPPLQRPLEVKEVLATEFSCSSK